MTRPSAAMSRLSFLRPFLILAAGAVLSLALLCGFIVVLTITWRWLALALIVFWTGFGAGFLTAVVIRDEGSSRPSERGVFG
jgi:hypothetical protein